MLLLSHEKWRFWFVIGGMPFILNAIVLGNSRGAVLGILAGGLVLFALKPAVYRKQFVMFGALGVVLIGMLAHDEFWERLSSLRAVTSDYQEEDLDFSARSRVGIIEAQWRMFLDHPFGVGHAGTEALSRDYLSEEYLAATRASDGSEKAVRSSHNTFMSVLVDQGIPGIVLLSALIFWAWRSVRLTTRRQGADSKTLGYAAAVGAALTVAAVAGQFSPYLKVEVQIWLLAILMSLVSFARGETSTAERTQPARQRVRRPIGTMGTAGMRRDRGGA
jgi:O-antigen ligase